MTRANYPIATVELVGPGGMIIVNETEAANYLAQGYQLKSDVAPAPVVVLKTIALDEAEIPVLKERAEKAGIPGFQHMKKRELIIALAEKGVTSIEVPE